MNTFILLDNKYKEPERPIRRSTRREWRRKPVLQEDIDLLKEIRAAGFLSEEDFERLEERILYGI